MRPTDRTKAIEAPENLEYIEGQVVRLYATIVLLLLVLGGLVWGTVTAIRIAPRALDDSVFVLLALGGMALAAIVLVLLPQLAQWAKRRV